MNDPLFLDNKFSQPDTIISLTNEQQTLVKLSNIIGIISIILLVYWVFIFISITVFGLKVFRENLTETFYLSVVGILALMFGALIINVMFNLTRIAEKHNDDHSKKDQKTSKKLGLVFALSFPVIFALLFGGDYLTSRKKEKMLVASAKSILMSDELRAKKLVDYQFSKKWILEVREIIGLYEKTDSHFSNITLIVADTLATSKVFLGFRDEYNQINGSIPPLKKDFIQKTTEEERIYLKMIFYDNAKEIRFSAHDGRYELFYPYEKNGKRVVLYFSDYQRYGKIGS